MSEKPIYHEYKQYRAKSEGKSKLVPTSADIEGPFYKLGAPFRTALVQNATLTLQGRVLDTDGKPVWDAVLDFWQANEEGVYVGYEAIYDFTLRGRQVVVPGGGYSLLTIHPGNYKIDDNEHRCAHIHVKVSALGFKPLTTQLYFSDDPYDATDHWFSKDRVIGSVKDKNVTFDFVLERE